MESHFDSAEIMGKVWPSICAECRQVLGSELHYQAMIYRIFREIGEIPNNQIGMNVKIWITNPRTKLFRELEKRKNKGYQGGFEPVPDIVLFSPDIKGDFRRRNNKNTLKHMLMAIEVKASERAESRLRLGEIIKDILKLESFRREARMRSSNCVPTMIVIDTAPSEDERMVKSSVDLIFESAKENNVSLFYLSPYFDRKSECDIERIAK